MSIVYAKQLRKIAAGTEPDNAIAYVLHDYGNRRVKHKFAGNVAVASIASQRSVKLKVLTGIWNGVNNRCNCTRYTGKCATPSAILSESHLKRLRGLEALLTIVRSQAPVQAMRMTIDLFLKELPTPMRLQHSALCQASNAEYPW